MFGAVRCKLDGESYYISSPDGFHNFVSNEIYEDSLILAQESDILVEEEIIEYMRSWGLWNDWEQDRLDELPEKIENTKLELYDYQSNPHDFQLCKRRIGIYREEMLELLNKKHVFDYITAEGFALLCKTNYIIGTGLRDSTFQPKWKDDSFFNDHSGLLDEARGIYNRTRIMDAQLRELSRTDPWRLYWTTCDKTNMFNRPPIELTDEQKSLAAWSRLYDNVYESMETPPDNVIQDDDLLDAWLIIQRRKRKEGKQEKESQTIKISKNQRINNAQNVFVMIGEDIDPITGKNIQMVKNREEALKLDEVLSTKEIKAIKKMRFDAIKEHGFLRHSQLPDVRHDLMLQATNMEIDAKKGKLK